MYSFNTVFIGQLAAETIINYKNQVFIDFPGGDLLYAAYAFKICDGNAGLISRVGENFPQGWLKEIQEKGFDIDGIKRIPSDIDHRSFYRITQDFQITTDLPQKYFSEIRQPFPKQLLGFSSNQGEKTTGNSSSNTSLKPADLPEEYLNARFLFIGPVDLATMSMIPAHFRSVTNSMLFIHPAKEIMHPSMFSNFPTDIRGSTALITKAEEIRFLFRGHTTDLWEIAEAISGYGVELIVILNENISTLVYSCPDRKRIQIPTYPTQILDPVGVESAFCGGFMAGYIKHFDPTFAATMGNAIKSIKYEGSTPGYLLEALPEFVLARFDFLKDKITIR